ncbi:MAG: hypothetical protein JNJ77_17205 [Planctomycetia bacterium]|nr:hypothetical protein [Planctomycetia bacterium]
MNYPVRCYGKECTHLAQYKIAARWSHGTSSELKTYGLSCESCLPLLFRDSLERQLKSSTLPGELGESPGIYRAMTGWGDSSLVRETQLEEEILKAMAVNSAK